MREQTWQKCQVVDGFANPITQAKSRTRKARAPGDLIFLFFAKFKCQFPWTVADPEMDQGGGAKEQGEQKILLGRHSILVDIT